MDHDYNDFADIDPTQLDFSLDIRDLSRELIITVRVLDDKTFAKLSKEASQLRDDIKREMARLKNSTP